ncbi:MAG: hypothetical protein U9R68_10410, partial [Planctomycetota bacterium]|nr:hypothetical protein [Planctomycetota bacterium]
EHLPGMEEIGVMDATRMGWRLLMSDFWPIWLLGLVVVAIQMGCSLVGSIPYIGGCFSLALAIFVQPPLYAGLFYAVVRVIDGQKAMAGQVFEGFRQRFWPSVVANLLPVAIGFGFGLVVGGLIFGMAFAAEGAGGDEEAFVIIAVLVAIPLAVILALVMLLFVFSMLAVWDYPESGWEAMKASVRVVKAHYLSTLGAALLFGLIGLGAYLAGLIACCVGIFFTMPVVMVWFTAALVYLYRAWTGQPLTQALAEGAADEFPPPPGEGYEGGEGPVPPSDIEPPPEV